MKLITETVEEVLLQRPPETELLIVMLEPTHTDDKPLIGDGDAFTLMLIVAEQPEIV